MHVPYEAKYLGLQEQEDGSWVFRRRWVYPLSFLFKAKGQPYQLPARVGYAADKAFYKATEGNRISMSISVTGLVVFFLSRAPIDSSIIYFLRDIAWEALFLSFVFGFIPVNLSVNKIACFCERLGAQIDETSFEFKPKRSASDW